MKPIKHCKLNYWQAEITMSFFQINSVNTG